MRGHVSERRRGPQVDGGEGGLQVAVVAALVGQLEGRGADGVQRVADGQAVFAQAGHGRLDAAALLVHLPGGGVDDRQDEGGPDREPVVRGRRVRPLQRVQCLGPPPLFLEEGGQVLGGGGVTGPEPNGLAAVGGRLAQPPLSAEGCAEVVVGLGGVRAEAQGLPVAGDRLVALAQRVQGGAEVAEGLDVAGPQPQGLAVTGDRLGGPALALEDGAEVVVGLGEARRQPHGLAQAGLGLRQPALAVQQGAEVIVGVGVVGLKPQGLAVARLGLGGPSEGREGQPQVAVEDGLPTVQAEGPADVPDRLLMAAGVVGGDAEQVPGVGVAGVRPEHLAVDLLGPPQVARLVVPDRRRQGLVDGRHGAFLTCRPVNSRRAS